MVLAFASSLNVVVAIEWHRTKYQIVIDFLVCEDRIDSFLEKALNTIIPEVKETGFIIYPLIGIF